MKKKKTKSKETSIIVQGFQKNSPPVTDKNGSAAYSAITKRVTTDADGKEESIILGINHLYNLSKADILKGMNDSIEETKTQIKELNSL